MGGSESRDKDSVTEVAGESFVRERPPDIERGTVLAGRYQIEDIIGKGGSGIVLRVFDRVAQNVVALKVLKSELARDAKWEKRFSRELRLGRPIQHPNVCRIFDIGEADGYRFLTMELASGGSLRDELKKTRALDRPLEERLADAKAVIGGLAALHAAGVVHRDFKPDNILRMGDGRLVLSDFGLATDAANAPGATVLIGTPHYMAPEVLGGEPASARSDVWALGVVLHEIFFGQRPERRSVSFDGSGRGPLRPSSSKERSLLALCERCLADTPLDRPADAGAVTQLFNAVTVGGAPRRRRRSRLIYGLCLAGVTVAVGVIAAKRHTKVVEGQSALISVPRRPTGTPLDWSGSRVIAEISGRVHCFSLLDANRARVIWGSPRRAEDVDLVTGQRRPSGIEAETYRVGCPELSPNGRALLFTGESKAGASEIRLSRSGDGHGAVTLTPGSDPVWLGTADEFLYSIDDSHVATFSLATMRFAIVSDPSFGDHRAVADKAVNEGGTEIGLVLYNDRAEFVAAVLDAKTLSHPDMIPVPPGTRIQFGGASARALLTGRFGEGSATAVEFDWSADALLNLGRYSGGYDVRWVRERGPRRVALVRRGAEDVWLYDDSARRRLTSDGQNFAASISRTGELLLTKLGADGNYRVWLQAPDASLVRLTSGSRDLSPTFGADGRSWAYADYASHNIMLCASARENCRVLLKDELLPMSPTLSPDGRSLVYITQLNTPRLTVVSTQDGHVTAEWGAYFNCPPLWSSSTTLWSVESVDGRYAWIERNTSSSEKTGKQVDVASAGVTADDLNCWQTSQKANPLFTHQVRVEMQEDCRLVATDGSPTAQGR